MARAERSGAGAFRLGPSGGRIGEARRSVHVSALPSRRGAERAWQPKIKKGSPAATGYQPLHGPVRGRLR